MIGLAVAFALALVVLFVATRSLAVSALSIATIVGIVSTVLGAMVLIGRDLGFMESICVTVIVGLAVDYVVHYGIAFMDHLRQSTAAAADDTRASGSDAVNEAVVMALTDLGVSVVGGATSSFGAALFLLTCTIKYLQQFGEFMALVIGVSLCFSSVLYPAVLAALAPVHAEASLVRWIHRKRRGRGGAASTVTKPHDDGGEGVSKHEEA